MARVEEISSACTPLNRRTTFYRNFFCKMLGLIWFLTVQLESIDKNGMKNIKLCVNLNCTDKSFTANLSDNCQGYTNIPDQFDIHGKTYDGEYYSILVNDEEYYIPNSCVLNQTEIVPMTIKVPLKSFNLLGVFRNISKYSETQLNLQNKKIDRPNLESKGLPEILDTKKLNKSISKQFTGEPGVLNTKDSIEEYINLSSKNVVDQELLTRETNQSQTSSEIFNLGDYLQAHYQQLFVKIKKQFSENIQQINYFIRANSNFELFTSISKLYLLDIVSVYKILIVVLCLIILYQRFTRTTHIQCAHQSCLPKLQSEIAQIFERNEKRFQSLFHDLQEKFSKHNQISDDLNLQIKNLQSKISIYHGDNDTLNAKILKLKAARNTLADSHKLTINSLESNVDRLLKDNNDKIKEIDSLQNELNIIKSQVVDLSDEKETLRQSHDEYRQYFDSFIKLFLSEPLSFDQPIDDSIKNITNLSKQQIIDTFSSISAKLSKCEQLEEEKLQIESLSGECRDLKEKNIILQQEIQQCSHKFSLLKEEKCEIGLELKAIKNHYKENEECLHEKCNQEKKKVADLENKLQSILNDSVYIPQLKQNIEDLKKEISSLELLTRKMKEDHSIELNNLFVANKKIERELDRTTQEKENYRLKLLKVLNDNQLAENEKNIQINFQATQRSSNPNSNRPNSPIKSSFYRNKTQSIDDKFHQELPPPPPPPPPPPMYPQAIPYSFRPPDASSPHQDNAYLNFPMPYFPPHQHPQDEPMDYTTYNYQ